MKSSTYKNKKGYALLELLFYISFFAVLSTVLINAMVAMSSSFKVVSVNAELIRSGNIMERISREIKQAQNIALIDSDSLRLNSMDNSGNPKTVQFVMAGTDLELYENDSLVGNLNSENVEVGTINFTQISTPKSQAVKVFLSVRSTNDPSLKEVSFYDTEVLRGGY